MREVQERSVSGLPSTANLTRKKLWLRESIKVTVNRNVAFPGRRLDFVQVL